MVHYRRIFFEQGIDYVATPTVGTTAPLIRLTQPDKRLRMVS